MNKALSLLAILSFNFVGVVANAATETEVFSEARSLFKAKKFEQAAQLYAQIPKSSQRWVLAKEEKAWSFFRLKNHEKALSEVRSLTNSYMENQIDLEPFLLQSLILFYNCDYKAVFKTIRQLKSSMTDYVEAMDTMGEGGLTEIQSTAIDKLVVTHDLADLKPKELHQMPRRFYLDQKAAKALREGQAPAFKARLRILANRENKNIHRLLQNLQLVEVESTQRAFIPNQFNGQQKSNIPKGSDVMVFNNDDEMWADEIDKTQADINLCASKTGRTL
jgi:hypothetical protein